MTPLVFKNNFIGRTKASITDAEIMRIMNLARMPVDEAVITFAPKKYNMIFREDLDEDEREYRLHYSTREIFQVQANLKTSDGGSDNWVTLKPANYGVEYSLGDDESQIVQHFYNEFGNAKYWRDGNFLFILSGKIWDATNGLKIYGNGIPLDITDLSLNSRDMAEYAESPNWNPGVPLAMQYPWLVMASRMYKLEADRKAELDPEEEQAYTLVNNAAISLADKTPVVQGNPSGHKKRYDGY